MNYELWQNKRGRLSPVTVGYVHLVRNVASGLCFIALRLIPRNIMIPRNCIVGRQTIVCVYTNWYCT